MLTRPFPSHRARSRVTARIRMAAVVLAVVAATFGGPGGLAPRSAAGGFVPGVIMEVNTTSDSVFPPAGGCSLRAAIVAANTGSGGYCPSSNPPAGQDSIRFNIGTGIPLIQLNSTLPEFSQPATIRGNTGGANAVRLRGPGSGSGITVGLGAPGSSVRNLRIDNFHTGVHLKSTATVAANVIGPNSEYGVFAQYGAGTIGGTNTFTPAPCSGDCNVIVGNKTGIMVHSGLTGTISGNFIGVGENGVTAVPNLVGIQLNNEGWTIGGTTAGARNVISGNTNEGVLLLDCAGTVACRIQGNYIGTTASGNAPRGNGKAGILFKTDGPATIGGTEPGAGNVISGNLGAGIHYQGSHVGQTLSIMGNKIGTTPFGQPMGNALAGILIKPEYDDEVGNAIIGSATVANGRNTIAYNGRDGVETDRNSGMIGYVEVRGNSIFDNGDKPFDLEEPTNFPRVPPTITGFWPLRGMTCASCLVDIYSDAGTEGRASDGFVTANGAGAWTYPGSLRGPRVTVTETNSRQRTSEYSSAVHVPPRPDGRIRLGTNSFVGNNVYNLTGVNQERTGSAVRGNTIKFGISVENDGPPDSFRLHATGTASTKYTVKYFRGTTDITTAVRNGTYTTPSVTTGGTLLITVKVKVTGTANFGSSVSRLVTITSVKDSTTADVVKFIGKRK